MSLVEKIFSQHQESRLPEVMVDDMTCFLESWNILDLSQVIQEEWLHWICLISEEVKDKTKLIIESLSSYVFDSSTRLRNLWLHIDSPDREESINQILTGLYSPINTYSNIPTLFVDTYISDEESMDFINNSWFINKFPNEFKEIKNQILTIFRKSFTQASEETLWFWTCMWNICFAHRWLKEKYWNKLLIERDNFVREFLNKFKKDISKSFSINWQESLIIFPNWLSKDWKKVSHTRFSDLDESDKFSFWKVSNLTFDVSWNIRPANTKVDIDNDKININRGWMTMKNRELINPLEN